MANAVSVTARMTFERELAAATALIPPLPREMGALPQAVRACLLSVDLHCQYVAWWSAAVSRVWVRSAHDTCCRCAMLRRIAVSNPSSK